MKPFHLFKTALISGMLFLTSVSVSGQGVYLKLGGGYTWGVGSETFQSYAAVWPYSGPVSVKLKRTKMNYGQGSNFSAGIGYMFTDNIGAELGAGYLNGAVNKAEVTDYHTNYGINLSQLFERSASMVLLKPSFILSAGAGHIKPYARTGFIIAAGTITEKYKFNNWGVDVESETEYSGGTGFGFQAGIGVNFIASDKISLYTEVAFSNLTYAPEKGKLTSLTKDGVNALESETRYGREIEFVEEYEVAYDRESGDYVNINYDEPEKRLKQDLLFSNIGFEIGLKYTR